jgi:hypothetical protein
MDFELKIQTPLKFEFLEAGHIRILCTLMLIHICITLDNNFIKMIQKH